VDGLRGGALASGIHSHLLHGDPSVAQFVGSVMKRVASPIFRMIKRWVFEGELEDTHVSSATLLQYVHLLMHYSMLKAEFFVVADPNVGNNELWAKKYTLNMKMLPTFIPV
jgi:gamma-tubulin complex component 3